VSMYLYTNFITCVYRNIKGKLFYIRNILRSISVVLQYALNLLSMLMMLICEVKNVNTVKKNTPATLDRSKMI
jgi:hypothetical protein